MNRPKLSIPAQIKNMQSKGIQFELCSEADARRFIEHNNYYYKLKAYAKNYDQYKEGSKAEQYINLDFAYLQDLSTIDAKLRKVILNLSIDLEHFLKVKMLSDFNMVDEDGYEIITELFNRYPTYQEDIESKSNTSTCNSIVQKYKENWAIWSIVELMSFGQFINLYKLFYERNPECNGKGEMWLYSIRMIRNAAAHNNCLINQMRPPYSRPIVPISELKGKVRTMSTGVNDKKVETRMTHPTVHDFLALLVLYNEIVPEPTRSRGMEDVVSLFHNRMPRHKEYYTKNQVLTSSYAFVRRIVDQYLPNEQ